MDVKPRRIVLLTEGHSDPHSAKTACSLIRYRRDEIVGVLDSTKAGQLVADTLGVGDDLQFARNLSECPRPNTLVIGIAPPGGKIPDSWRGIVLEAIGSGMNVVSGLHDFLGLDAEFAEAASAAGVELTDVRRNAFGKIARRPALRSECLRLLTVGHDCSVGKMVTAIEMTRELQSRGASAKFVATGQTGIMIEGDGLPLDCIVADFVSGAAEQLVVENQHHDYVIVEGQGSLVHPSYSAVTLGLLHGVMPQGLIFCYEIGRQTVTGIPDMAIPNSETIISLNEQMASVMLPCRVIGIAVNGRLVDEARIEQECAWASETFGVPACDVIRHGVQPLVDAAVQLRVELTGQFDEETP